MYVLVHFLGHVLGPHAPVFYAEDAPPSQWHFAALFAEVKVGM